MKREPKCNRKKARYARLPEHLQHINLNAAGIDVGSGAVFAAVPQGRDVETVREFPCYTADLHRLADWLVECQIDTVVMESTGVYWIPVFELLESRGFAVQLVNARHVKNVPGRKTDVLDCQWLQQLHTYGLLQGSFRPPELVCALRAYLRQRANLVRYASAHIQHMQKALTQMNLLLHNVVSDLTGATGMRIMKAILAGERDPVALANLRDPRCKNSVETIRRSLEGHYRDEHLFTLQQAVDLYEVYQTRIAECDRQIEHHLQRFEVKTDDSAPQPGKKQKNTPGFELHAHLLRITGVDLTRIDGLDAHSILKLVSETGIDMTPWRTEKHFTSWLGLCPGNKVSGGKSLSGKTKPAVNRAASVFRLAAHGLHNSKSALGAYLRRQKARLGAPKAITATAHKLARIYYRMLKSGTAYADAGQDYYEEQYRKRVVHNLSRKAHAMGLTLVPIESQHPDSAVPQTQCATA
jgi:transposase